MILSSTILNISESIPSCFCACVQGHFYALESCIILLAVNYTHTKLNEYINMHNVSWLKQIQWQSQASLNRICAALCLTLISISVNINLIHENYWQAAVFKHFPSQHLINSTIKLCLKLLDYPLIQYTYIVKSHIHNIWKREQISGSVNMLAIRALWEKPGKWYYQCLPV